MASPVDNTTRSPSPDRPHISRAITAPELAAALERSKSQVTSPRIQIRLPSEGTSTAGEADDIDDLRIDSSTQPSPAATEEDEVEAHGCHRRHNLPTPQAWQTYFMQEVAGDKYLEFQLLLMTVSTGMLDAMTYTTYSVFTSKMTGNTLFLALYAFRLPDLSSGIEHNVGISMGVFIAGAIFFGHLGHYSRQRRRIWLLVSNAFQAFLMLGAAAIRYWVSRERTGPGPMAILTLLAFAESGQIANALNVSMPELNTTMVTGAFIQLCTDKNFFHLRNAKRNRRLAFIASMLLGCVLGSAVLRYSSPSALLVVTAATKGILFPLFFLNRGLVEKRFQLEDGKEKVEGCITPASRVLWGD